MTDPEILKETEPLTNSVPVTSVRDGAKVGQNVPCPRGGGKKDKKCWLGEK